MTKKKRTGGRPRPASPNQFPEPIEEHLRAIAQQAVEERMSLDQVVHTTPLAQLIGRIVELSLQGELEHHLGYRWGERDADSSGTDNVRNGYSKKRLKTQFGATEVQVPRDRQATFEPRIVPRYAQLDPAIADQIVSMYTSGLSTRDIRSQIEQIYHIEADDDLVSRVLERVEPELVAWRNRPLQRIWPCVFIDAVHLKVRQATGVESSAVYTALGYDCDGVRHVLGVWIGHGDQPSESASFWHRVLLELKNRGVEDIFILCADGLTGLEQAVAVTFPQARFQPCVVHLIRNSMRYVPHNKRKEATEDVRRIYQAPTFEAAKEALRQLEARWSSSEANLVRVWQQALPRLENLWGYGSALRRLVYTTNIIENLHRQVRKATKTRSSFPTADSALRLVTLVLRRDDERHRKARSEWTSIRLELELTFGERMPRFRG